MRFSEMAVVIDQHHGFKPLRSQRCRLKSYSHLEYYNNFRDHGQTNHAHSLTQAFNVANIHRSFSTPCLSLATSPFDEEFDNPKIEIVRGYKAQRVRALVVDVAIAMTSGFDPTPLSNGLGGAYLFHGRNGVNIAVAKPVDEEPLAFNNPKGFGGRMFGQPGLKRSVRIGENGVRELAAYILDHEGFAGVPPTALVKISHATFHTNTSDGMPSSSTPCKIASLQRFVNHDFDAGELGPSGFSVSSIHRIGIFDIRLLNLDRHAGNILIKKQEPDNYNVGVAELVPIDHGLCLPEWLDDPYFEWLHWPQASFPFSGSELDYISNLNPFKDAELLRTELPGIREASIRILILCTIFLKQAASAGLCLSDIGKMMTREFCGCEEKMSEIENLCAQAMAVMPQTISGNDKSIGGTEESELFQFEKECEDLYNQALDIPSLLPKYPGTLKLSRIPKFLSAVSKNESTEENNNSDDCKSDMGSFFKGYNNRNDDDKGDGDNNNRRVSVLTKSLSFSVNKHNDETEVISFAEMSQDEWESFVDCFEKLLPELFDSTKCSSMKQRMGSCKF